MPLTSQPIPADLDFAKTALTAPHKGQPVPELGLITGPAL